MNGTWASIAGSIDGADEFLKVAGVGWARRQVALMVLNQGTTRLTINAAKDAVELAIVNVRGQHRIRHLRLDGSEFQDTFGPFDKPGIGRAAFDGGCLRISAQLGAATMTVARWIHEDTLCERTELATAKGSAAMTRIFSKETSEIPTSGAAGLEQNKVDQSDSDLGGAEDPGPEDLCALDGAWVCLADDNCGFEDFLKKTGVKATSQQLVIKALEGKISVATGGPTSEFVLDGEVDIEDTSGLLAGKATATMKQGRLQICFHMSHRVYKVLRFVESDGRLREELKLVADGQTAVFSRVFERQHAKRGVAPWLWSLASCCKRRAPRFARKEGN